MRPLLLETRWEGGWLCSLGKVWRVSQDWVRGGGVVSIFPFLMDPNLKKTFWRIPSQFVLECDYKFHW